MNARLLHLAKMSKSMKVSTALSLTPGFRACVKNPLHRLVLVVVLVLVLDFTRVFEDANEEDC